jgi:hypothetical protein
VRIQARRLRRVLHGYYETDLDEHVEMLVKGLREAGLALAP